MAKQLIIDTRVKTDQIDKAVSKLGQLKDLGKGLKIQYDIDGKPIDIAIDKSLNLQKQVKLLTAELRRTKEGTAEFQLLSSKLGEAQDGLAKTTAKSKDLFSSLSMIPGPVGQFFSQLQGSIELLKTFSSFTFKDLSFQFKETADDIADIGKNLTGVETEGIDKVGNSAESAAEKVSEFKDQLAGTAAESVATAGANDQVEKSINASTNAIIKSNSAYRLINQSKQRLVKLMDDLEDRYDVETKVTKKGILIREAGAESFRKLSAAEMTAVKSGKALTITTEGLIVAEEGAAVATTTLGNTIKTVLISTGVLIAIVALGAIISKLVEFATSTKDAEGAARSLTDALEDQQTVLQNDLDAIDMANKANITRAKIAGKSEEEITKLTKEANADRLAEFFRYRTILEGEQDDLKTNTKLSEEDRLKFTKEINDKLRKNDQDITKQILSNQQFRLDEELKQADKRREGLKKTGDEIAADSKKVQDQIAANTIKANDTLLRLQQENAVNRLKTERERQDKQLQTDKENEEKEISKLFQVEGRKTQLTVEQENIKAKLLEQIKIKYNLKVDKLEDDRQKEDDKRFEEDEKKLIDYQNKIFDIKNKANSNELGRAKAARLKEFEDAQSALLQDINFQKESVEEKIRILTALETAYKADIQKLNDDDAQKNRDSNLKRLQDELRLLQIKGEALRQGTKSFFDNQRAILKTAEKQELADLEDRAIKEKMSIEQLEKEKLAIKEKYLKAAKDISKQELEQVLAAAQATLGVAQSIATDIGKVASLGQQVALEEANKRYIEQNELDKKTITNKLELEKKLLDNQKKFAIEEDAIKKKAFEENKKIQIAQAIIATLQSAVGAFSSLIATPFVGPVIAPIAAAAALVFGYKQVDLIKKTQYQSSLRLQESQTLPDNLSGTNYGENYEKGGMIGGKRHAEGGTLIEAEKGEAIMTRGAVTLFGPMLSMMNQAGGGTSFNSNLLTTRQDKPIVNNPAQEQAPMILKTYVVSNELTTEANKQARLKNLSTI